MSGFVYKEQGAKEGKSPTGFKFICERDAVSSAKGTQCSGMKLMRKSLSNNWIQPDVKGDSSSEQGAEGRGTVFQIVSKVFLPL